MPENSPNLALPYLMPSQAQKHVTHNEALEFLDALVQLSVLDRDLTSAPGSPAEGDRYIVAAGATGTWAGQDGKVAAFLDGAWSFFAPGEGWIAWVADEDTLLTYTGTVWSDFGGALGAIQNLSLLGVGTTADATNPISARLNKALLTAKTVGEGGDGDLRVTANKETAGDTVSYLFQTGYSGRAEFGLIGDDDFTLKVSPDGSTWNVAYVVDRNSGKLSQYGSAAYYGAYGVGRAGSAVGGIYFNRDPDNPFLLFSYGASGSPTDIGQLRASGSGGYIGITDMYGGAYRLRVFPATGAVDFPAIGTTASAANAHLDSGTSNKLLRSTSSIRYKRDIEAVDKGYSYAFMDVAPIWYRSTAPADNPAHSFWGWSAEAVADVDQRLVHWGYSEEDYELVDEIDQPAVAARPAVLDKDGKVIEPAVEARPEVVIQVPRLKADAVKTPQGVAYERITVHHHVVINDLIAEVAALKARVAALEGHDRARDGPSWGHSPDARPTQTIRTRPS